MSITLEIIRKSDLLQIDYLITIPSKQMPPPITKAEIAVPTIANVSIDPMLKKKFPYE